MVTILENADNVWAVVASGGELHVFSRQGAGKWSEIALEQEDAEEIDRDGSLVLEALYQQEMEPEETSISQFSTEEPEGMSEDEDEEEGDEEREDEDEESEQRRGRGRTRARAKAK